MGINTSQQAYGQGTGTTPTGGVYVATRDPTSLDVGNPWPLAQLWLNNSNTNLWYLNNFTSTAGYVQANWILVSIASGILQSISDTADTPVDGSGSTGTPPFNVQLINLDGSIGITSDPGNHRLIFAYTGTTSTTWVVVTTDQTLVHNEGYFANGGGNLNFTLPATASIGDTFQVVAMSAGGWTVKQNAGQSIGIANLTTTVGTGGSIASLNQGDWIEIVCNVTNTGFRGTIRQGNVILT